MNPNIMLLIAVCAAGLAPGIAGVILARRAVRQARALQDRLDAAEGRLASLETSAGESAGHIRGLIDGLRHMALLQHRPDVAKGRDGLREAITLTRRGISAAQLVKDCGISAGEARLIEVLHGREAESGLETADAH